MYHCWRQNVVGLLYDAASDAARLTVVPGPESTFATFYASQLLKKHHEAAEKLRSRTEDPARYSVQCSMTQCGTVLCARHPSGTSVHVRDENWPWVRLAVE